MAGSPLKIAVAGSGSMAQYHISRFSTMPDVSVVGVYDRSPERARATAEKCGVPQWFSDVNQMVSATGPDAVSVAVADSQQYSVALSVLQSRVPAFIEKPFTTDVFQADHLVQLQDELAVPVVVNFSKINYPAIWGLIAAVRNGVFGTIRTVELKYRQSWIVSTVWGEWWQDPRWLWRISSSHGGGGAYRDLGSHLLYLALQLGGDIRSIKTEASVVADRSKAVESGYSCDLNDRFVSRVWFRSGAEGVVSGGYAESGYVNEVYARVEGDEGSAEVIAAGTKDILTMARGPASSRRASSAKTVRFAKVYSTYQHFVDCLTGARSSHSFSPSAQDGLRVQKLLAGVPL